MSTGIGVANVKRQAYGTRYTLTRDNDSRIVVGYVEVTGVLTNVRNCFNEPVPVGSAKYDAMTAAVKRYASWAEAQS